MANPNKFTAKEVLNKVLLDSSGNAVTANSVTSQEALNSVLDTTNNRLNMSLAGGTISGDVTISGDLTVNGSGTNSYDEIINGDLHVKSDSGNSTSAFLVEKNDGTDVFVVDTTNSRANIGARVGTAILEVKGSVDNDYAGRFENTHSGGYGALVKIDGTTANDLAFQVRADSTNILTINGDSSTTFSGNVGIGVSPSSKLHINVGTDQNLEVTSVSSKLHLMGTNNARSANIPLTLGFSEYIFEQGNIGIGGTPDVKLHIMTSDASLTTADANVSVIIEENDHTYLELLTPSDKQSGIIFSNGTLSSSGIINYNQSTDAMTFNTDGDTALTIDSSQNATFSGAINSSMSSTSVLGNLQNTHASGYGLKIQATGGTASQYIATFNDKDDNVKARVYGDGRITSFNSSGAVFRLESTNTNITGAELVGKVEAYISDASGNLPGVAGSIDWTTSGSIDGGSSKGTTLTLKNYLESAGLQTVLTIDKDKVATFGGAITSGANINIPSGNILYLDGGSNTYIYESTADTMSFACNSSIRFQLDNNSRISLSNNDGGTLNTAFGYQAGTALASGSTENTIFGHQAGLALSTGDYNTAIGALALKTEDAGNRAVAVGTGALFSQNVADVAGNVAVGFTAGYYNVTGTNNTAIGHEALQGASGNSHSNNTGVGYQSLKAITTGGSNVGLGGYAGDTITDGTENTCIGYAARTSSASATNQIVIGRATTGVADNSVTLGNADVTNVYMAQDSGATVHCGGIRFPDTQSSSSDANQLDDYEEGEYTTTITGATSGSWVLDSAQNKLSYTKIGRLVTVIGKFETDSGSGAGSLKINLPFTAANLTSGAGIAAGSITINRYGSTSIATQITPIVFEDTNYINVQIHSTDGTSNESYVQANDIDGIFEGQLSITYFTD